MSTRDKEDDDEGGDKRKSVKIDEDSKKKVKRWKSLKEMKEYLRSEFEKKTKSDERNEKGTYLHYAAYLGEVDATKILIGENVEVDAVDFKGWTALHWAAGEGHVNVVKVLIEEGADVNAVEGLTGETALHLAAKDELVDVAKVLLQNGAHVNAVEEEKLTPLHWAAFCGHVDVAKVLIENDADVNAGDDIKETALHHAASHGYVDVVKVLIQNGADVNAVDEFKNTVLPAASRKHIRCTLQLLCFGVEIDEKAIKDDKTELLRPIENRLKLLRNGNRMGTSLMSDEERRFMWDLGFVLAVKHPAIAFGTYRRIRSFITFHGIFMGPGYDLGEESIWKKQNPVQFYGVAPQSAP